MTFLQFLGTIAVVGVIGGVLWGLHRLCLWLEARGWLYYLNKRSESSASTSLLELQKALEPQMKQVILAREEKRHSQDHSGEGNSKADQPRQTS